MIKDEKFFDTGFRILEVLKHLSNENLSKNDLINKLSILDKNNIYSFEAFIKYFNTLSLLGLDIEKDKNIYSLKKALFSVNLTKEEKKLFIEILQNIGILNNFIEEEAVRELSYKLIKYISSDEFDNAFLNDLFDEAKRKSSLSVNANLINSFKTIIKDKQQIKLIYLSKNNIEKSLIAELKEIKEKNEKIYIKCYVPSMGRNKNISVDSIISIVNLPKRVSDNSIKNSVTFELYGRLASLYKLKASEKVISFKKDCLTISNTEEDKDILLRRLLKYGENCKIVSPQDVKEDFLALVNGMISNFEVKSE